MKEEEKIYDLVYLEEECGCKPRKPQKPKMIRDNGVIREMTQDEEKTADLIDLSLKNLDLTAEIMELKEKLKHFEHLTKNKD